MLSQSGSALARWAPELLVASSLGTLHTIHHTHGEAELYENSNPKDPSASFPLKGFMSPLHRTACSPTS